MSQRYLGGIITANPTTPTMTSESGVWTLEQQFQYSSVWSPEIIGNSLRFRSSASAYLNRTYGTPTSSTTWTYSYWVKRGALSSYQTMISGTGGGGSGFLFNTDNTIGFYSYSGGYQWNLVTTQVFRDPSAWYHIIVAYDSTQATSSNRVKIYVNGLQVTSFSTATYPSLNVAGYVGGAAGVHRIGLRDDGYYYLDGYMAEIYFVDGQALTPSSFGAFDSTGVWQPLPYTGTFGTNGFYVDFSDNSSVNALGLDSSGNTSASSTTAPVTLGTDGTGWTGEGIRQVIPASAIIWGGNKCRVKLTGGSSGLTVVGCAIGKKAAAGNAWDFDGNQVAVTFSGSASVSVGVNTTVYSDWISFPISSANSYVVGIAISNSGTNTVQRGTNTGFTCYEKVGGYTDATSTAPSGYSSTASNTVLFAGLDLQANNWTPNNFSLTAGTTYDWMLDSPTNSDNGGTGRGNYCVLNPLDKYSNVTLSNANLSATFSAYTGFVRSTFALPSTGKWYWEGTVPTSDPRAEFGIATLSQSLGVDPQGASGCWFWYSNGSTSLKYNAGSGTSWGSAWASGDTIGVAFDADAGTLTYYLNGSLQGGGAAATGLTGTYSPMVGFGNNTSTAISVNFGQRPFAQTPPSGFLALNTQNLSTPTILNGAQVMAATTYTGNGTSLTINNGANTTIGTSFKPDFVWLKSRSNAFNHWESDSVRGVSNFLSPNQTVTEASYPALISAYNSNGFSLGNDAGGNTNAATYVAWQWQAGQGTTSSNTSGSITSTVSVNATAGFSVVTFTANGSAGATVGHGLGVAPAFYIIKCRSNAGTDWMVYHQSLGASAFAYLDLTNAAVTGNNSLTNGVAPSSTLITLGGSSNFNVNNYTNVIYAWAAVAGYSAFGSYTGNGSADGPFVYCGFKPRFILLKNSGYDNFQSWVIYDTSRSTYNVDNVTLQPNSSNAESTSFGADIDILSNGFKVRNSNTVSNASGTTIIYAAFAENPFKIARAR